MLRNAQKDGQGQGGPPPPIKKENKNTEPQDEPQPESNKNEENQVPLNNVDTQLMNKIEKIASLVDQKTTQQDIQKALKSSDGDINKAIEFIYQMNEINQEMKDKMLFNKAKTNSDNKIIDFQKSVSDTNKEENQQESIFYRKIEKKQQQPFKFDIQIHQALKEEIQTNFQQKYPYHYDSSQTQNKQAKE